ncbi:MAG TPA: hypothetical protein VFA07_14435 [Chthonomonadaceae bacterium]|nr:hypothetical protein [Chthonomonadaceae bacterium]
MNQPIPSQTAAASEAPAAKPTSCAASPAWTNVPGEVRCPVCYHIVPPEQIGYKLHCRRCGYLESCCNPL